MRRQVTRSKSRPAVFLDRDGTINAEVDYLSDPDQLVLLPGAGRAIARLNAAGYLTVVVTNQSGIARGLLSEQRLDEIHARLRQLLAQEGGALDAIHHCPHHPTIGAAPYRRECDCRKPLPGMYERAARELGLDLQRSWAVGDSPRDLEAAAALGVPGILVASGKALASDAAARFETAEDLAQAVERIVGTSGQ
jgi:D-glycero-D-manno-heptose 1,7-bisphosphate phosphatase